VPSCVCSWPIWHNLSSWFILANLTSVSINQEGFLICHMKNWLKKHVFTWIFLLLKIKYFKVTYTIKLYDGSFCNYVLKEEALSHVFAVLRFCVLPVALKGLKGFLIEDFDFQPYSCIGPDWFPPFHKQTPFVHKMFCFTPYIIEDLGRVPFFIPYISATLPFHCTFFLANVVLRLAFLPPPQVLGLFKERPHHVSLIFRVVIQMNFTAKQAALIMSSTLASLQGALPYVIRFYFKCSLLLLLFIDCSG